jgi:NADPH:quinone reductase-like Zn-dependent oxidoreductase
MTGKARQIVRNGILAPTMERPVPRPRAGEVLLKIHATSLNFHDLIGIDGGIRGLPVPRVPCSDASATVLAAGDGVEHIAGGDAVIPNFFLNWISGPISRDVMSPVLGDQIDGTLQTYLCLPAKSVVRAPAGLSHDEIATLGCAALTAWRSVVVEAQLQPGQTVVLQGTGGVSLAALAFARMLGARVIITSSSDEKLARAKTLGADVLINYRTTPDWSAAVLDATAGEGANLVVEVGGGETLARAVNATKIGGHISVIGVLSGYQAANFPLAKVMGKNLTVRGITVGSVANLDAMCRAIEVNGYRPVIDGIFDLDSAHEAVATMKKQGYFGKIVIRIAEAD